MDSLPVSPLVIAAIGAVVVLLTVAFTVVKRISVAGPNEAFIITGKKGRGSTGTEMADLSGQKVVMGASVFVLPFVQQLHVMDLSSRRLSVSIKGAVSQNGIKVDLDGVAIVKVGGNEALVRAAAQRFLGQQDSIEPFTQEVLAGALRSIAGGLTVEEIIRDRAAFNGAVAKEAESSLTGQGLVLDTFQIQDVRTEGSYLDDLGRPEAAAARREADIAEARANQAAEQERLLAEEQVANSRRQLELREAEIRSETDAAKAEAEAAGPLARAAQQQRIIAEEERVAERTAQLKERQLDTEVRKPADAERYRVEQAAEADKKRTVLAAEAQRDAKVAEAEGVQAIGKAEADALTERADALARYGEAAVLEMLVGVLPDMVAKASEPLGNIDQMTVISTDGAAQLPRQVAGNVAQGMQMLSDLTGVDINKVLQGFAAKAAANTGAAPVDTTATEAEAPTGDTD